VLQLYYKRITNVLQWCYKCVTKILQMKAKKTTPKSIRFNIENLEFALSKSALETPQELVDFLLSNYCNESKEIDEVVKSNVDIKEIPLVESEKELSKADLFKLMRGKL